MHLRGPDDEGVESLGDGSPRSAVLGNRRLAIVDPSPLGHQPMVDRERGNVITFNGMIFNFRQLRRELEGRGERFSSDCDTEVVLRAYGVFGKDCVQMLHGMFGFAIWDAKDKTMLLARDRFGIKPLYYSDTGQGVIFSSQVRPILGSGFVLSRIDGKGVASYLQWGASIEPQTCLNGISSLRAGHRMTVAGKDVQIERYWEPPIAAEETASRAGVVAELRERLSTAVDTHLVSDAPLGVFLSGGLDSSALAALAGERTGHLRTVSVVFDDALSERRHMATVSEALRTEQSFVELDAPTLLEWSREAIQAMDQPTADAVNTFVVSRAAHELGLKVALSGLGADELLNGYGHARKLRLLEGFGRLPAPLRHAGALALAPASRPGARKAAAWLRDPEDRFGAYAQIRRLHHETVLSRLMPSTDAATHVPFDEEYETRSPLNALSVLDMSFYMRNVLLRDTDAMSMANSLEVRVPFLEDGLAEWILRLPDEVKQGRPKSLLIDAVRDLLPVSVWDRPKQGFTLPFERWLKGSMRDEVTATLQEPVAMLDGIISHVEVDEVWQAFLRGQTSWQRPWALYVLYRWAATL